MASTSLSRTPASAGNQKTWTFSAWVKRSTLGNMRLLSTHDGSNADNQLTIKFDSSNRLQFFDAPLNSTVSDITTNRVFRDVSAWYHIVASIDSTQATASNRIKLYVNGVQETSLAVSTYGSQNFNTQVNGTNPHQIGRRSDGIQYFDGQMAHVHLIDGTAYDADTFGETDATTGIWKPKGFNGSYGTNGFFLKFENSGAFGTDSSGNSNNFTVNGTMTQTIDTPSNVFATLNPLGVTAETPSFSLGNTKYTTNTSNNFNLAVSTLAVSSGKYYAEFKHTSGNYWRTGILVTDKLNEFSSNSIYCGRSAEGWDYYSDTGQYTNNASSTSYGDTYTANDIIGVAVDLDNNYLYFSKNGTWQNSGDPTSGATGTGGIDISSISGKEIYFGGGAYADGSNTGEVNFGNGYFGTTAVSSAQNPDDGIGIFEYAVPTGYKALCTKSINAQEYD